jgi:hypothetical protein
VDFPEQLTLAIVEVPGPDLLGFAVEPPEWRLEGQMPAVELHGSWGEIFPELARDLGGDDWQAAWRAWCEPLRLPEEEVLACRCERGDDRLRVIGPRRLVECFRAGLPAERLAREGWVLAGSGRSREAAPIELLEDRANG